MDNSLAHFFDGFSGWVLTYWLHSTLLLGTVALGGIIESRYRKYDESVSHGVRERAWKFAAVAGLLTALVQVQLGTGFQLTALPVMWHSQTAVAPAAPEAMPLNPRQNGVVRLEDILARVPKMSVTDPATSSKPQIGSATAPVVVKDFPDTPFTWTSEPPTDRGRATANLKPVVGNLQWAAPRIPDAVHESAPTAPVLVVDEESPLRLGVVGWSVAVWSSISIVVLAWQSWRFRRLLSDAVPASWNVIRRLESIRQRAGVSRRIEILKSGRITEPVAYGLLNWRIAIPTSLEADIPGEELDAILAHEIAHLRRGDTVWLLIGRVLTTCLAFQPLNFLARRQWQLHAEFQCDDWAVANSVDAVCLARSLTTVAEFRSAANVTAMALPAGGRRSHITERVERLLAGTVGDGWNNRWRRTALTATGVVVAALLIYHGPTADATSPAVEREAPLSTPADASPPSIVDVKQQELLKQLDREVSGLDGDLDKLTADLELLQLLLLDLPEDAVLRDRVARLQRSLLLLRSAADSPGE